MPAPCWSWAYLQGALCLALMKSYYWAFCTVIHGGVLGSQATHLQISKAPGIISGEGESALHGVCIVYVTTFCTNRWDPFQPFPRSLEDPFHVAIRTVKPEAAQESLSDSPVFTNATQNSTSCTSHWTPANTENLVRKLTNTHCSFHSCPLNVSDSP
jgi:hypothetical protein